MRSLVAWPYRFVGTGSWLRKRSWLSSERRLRMAELVAGPHATSDPAERARRQDRLQRAEAAFDPLPFDGEAARSYGRIVSAVTAVGRKARGRRAVDLLIAATALSVELPPYTRNGDAFESLGDLIEVVVPRT